MAAPVKGGATAAAAAVATAMSPTNTPTLHTYPRDLPASWRTRLIEWDRQASYDAFAWYRARMGSNKLALLVLEASGHGVPWLIWPLVLFALDTEMGPVALSVLFHFYLLSVLDLAVIGVIKPLVGRQRPGYNGGLTAATIHAVDQFSFPSGHATRSAFVAAYVFYVASVRPNGIPGWMASPLFLFMCAVWGAVVPMSRVWLGRHHILDVVVGGILGLLYIGFIDQFWIPDEIVAAKRDLLLAKPVARAAASTITDSCSIVG